MTDTVPDALHAALVVTDADGATDLLSRFLAASSVIEGGTYHLRGAGAADSVVHVTLALGAVSLLDLQIQVPDTGGTFTFEATVTIRQVGATGKVIATGEARNPAGAAVAAARGVPVAIGTEQDIDTTVDLTLLAQVEIDTKVGGAATLTVETATFRPDAT